jgi:hypothetical protein
MFSVDSDCQGVQNFEKVIEYILIKVVVLRNQVILNEEKIKVIGFCEAFFEKEGHNSI